MTQSSVDDIMLMAFIDGALEPAAAAKVEAKIAADPKVAGRVKLMIDSTELLRQSFCAELAVPAEVQRRAVTTIGGDWRRRTFSVAMPVAAAIIVAFAVGVLFEAGRGSLAPDGLDHVLQEVGEYHAVFAQETSHLVEVPATQLAEIRMWLGERVGFPLAVPDLRGDGLEFKGARLLVVDGRPVAQLMYTDAAGAPIALCAGSSQIPDSPNIHLASNGDTRLFGSAKAGRFFVVAGPSGRQALLQELSNNISDLLVVRS